MLQRTLILVALLLLFVDLGHAQSTKIGVKLGVSAKESIKDQIDSYIRRELRSLSDIDLYSPKPDFEISIIAIEPGNAVAISVVVERIYDFSSILDQQLSKTNISPSSKELVLVLGGKQQEQTQHFLQSDSRTNLDSLCKAIVASIDSETFEPRRRSARSGSTATNSQREPVPNTPRTTTKPVTSVDSPFTPEYVGGDKTVIRVKNDTDRLLTLVFGGIKYTVVAGGERDIDVEGGRYEYSASVPNATPKSGVADFAKGYRWSWRFFIVVRRR